MKKLRICAAALSIVFAVLCLSGCAGSFAPEIAAPTTAVTPEPADEPTAGPASTPEPADEPTAEPAQEQTAGAVMTKVEGFTGFTEEDMLHTEGENIVNGHGETVVLRGTNAGGWMCQEEWMCPTDADCLSTTISVLDDRFGEEERRRLLGIYMDTYWQEEDFENCAAMGMSVIRIPVTYMLLETQEDWERLDRFITACGEYGMYAIIDLHGAYGSANGEHHSGIIGTPALFTDSECQDQTEALWVKIAERYKGWPQVAGYDLLNEPSGTTGRTNLVQHMYFDRLYKAIRAVDPDHIIIMESCWEAYDLPQPSKYGWENVVYELHYYDWDDVTDGEKQVEFIKGKKTDLAGSKFGVPILIGEFTFFECWDAWETNLALFNEMGWSWTTWSYQATGNTSWGLYNMQDKAVSIQYYPAEEIEKVWSEMREGRWLNEDEYNVIAPALPGNLLYKWETAEE